MTKKLSPKQKTARVVLANGTSEQRGDRVQRAVRSVKAKARIDFVRSVRGR